MLLYRLKLFTELTPTQLVLRKIIDFSDVTICLDRRNASGCIETYLEPILYKCSVSIRLYRLYRSPHSVRPYLTQISIFCSKVALTLTEPQLPMLIRILNIILDLNESRSTDLNSSADDNPSKRNSSSCSSSKNCKHYYYHSFFLLQISLLHFILIGHLLSHFFFKNYF